MSHIRRLNLFEKQRFLVFPHLSIQAAVTEGYAPYIGEEDKNKWKCTLKELKKKM